jgi:hypothetical protein
VGIPVSLAGVADDAPVSACRHLEPGRFASFDRSFALDS